MGKDRAEISTVNGTIAALEVRLVKWMIGADAHTLHRRQRNRNDLNVLSPGSCPDNGVHLTLVVLPSAPRIAPSQLRLVE